jgi:hypothetical protein
LSRRTLENAKSFRAIAAVEGVGIAVDFGNVMSDETIAVVKDPVLYGFNGIIGLAM